MTFDEARHWLKSIEGDPLETLHLTAIFTGMRQGELLGLRWSDIDWDQGTITVAQTVWIHRRQIYFEESPKNHQVRTVPIPPAVAAKLRKHRAEQKWQRRLAQEWTDYGLVWTRDNGLPLRSEYALRHFQRTLEIAGLKRMRFHDLRHSAATLLLAMGTPIKDVAEWLGHSVQMTTQLYGHVIPELQKQTALKYQDKLLGSSSE